VRSATEIYSLEAASIDGLFHFECHLLGPLRHFAPAQLPRRFSPKAMTSYRNREMTRRANSGSETFHSITSSARARSDRGTVRPSRFGRPMRSCVVNSRTRSTLALSEHF
jgi:hypothetical protein